MAYLRYEMKHQMCHDAFVGSCKRCAIPTVFERLELALHVQLSGS